MLEGVHGELDPARRARPQAFVFSSDLASRPGAGTAGRPLAYAVSALDWLLGRWEVPEAVRRELPTLGRLERGFMRLVARRSGVETPGELIVALSIPGLAGKAAYLAELTFPR